MEAVYGFLMVLVAALVAALILISFGISPALVLKGLLTAGLLVCLLAVGKLARQDGAR